MFVPVITQTLKTGLEVSRCEVQVLEHQQRGSVAFEVDQLDHLEVVTFGVYLHEIDLFDGVPRADTLKG